MTFFVWLKTHTQAERKIMEGKREALVKEALESSTGSTLQDKLAELDLIKPRPYGTFPVVRSNYFLPDHSILHDNDTGVKDL